MRSAMRYVFLGVILLYSGGCAQKSAKLQRSLTPPDKTLFETGSDYLKRSQYVKARLAFQTLISTYPDSDMAAESYLAMGDSFYDEGGTSNLMMAQDQYRNFIVFFPTHPRAPDAQMKIISSEMKMMNAPDRDQQGAVKAEQEIRKFLTQFPDSDFVPIARQYLVEVQENLARSDLGIGRFYSNRGNYLGAVGRFQEILDKYPAFSGMDEVLFEVASIQQKAQSEAGYDLAAGNYSKIVRNYPFSKYAEESRERLKSLGKPTPEVDEQAAAANRARLSPGGFSPLKPFVDFTKALGFVGPPDRYEQAKRAVAEEKAKNAAALAEGEGKSDGILIQSVLTKSADGETKDTTTVLEPGEAGSEGAAGEEAKKPAEKRKRKNPNRK